MDTPADLGVARRLVNALGRHADHHAPGVERRDHRDLVDATGEPADHRPAAIGGHLGGAPGGVEAGVARVTRADDAEPGSRQPARRAGEEEERRTRGPESLAQDRREVLVEHGDERDPTLLESFAFEGEGGRGVEQGADARRVVGIERQLLDEVADVEVEEDRQVLDPVDDTPELPRRHRLGSGFHQPVRQQECRAAGLA